MIDVLKFGLKVIMTFILTNIQDIVILMNFFLESSENRSLLKIDHVIFGQYLGFSTLLMLSLMGYTISYILPVKLFGFLGFVIILFGLNGLKHLWKQRKDQRENEQVEFIRVELVRIYSLLKKDKYLIYFRIRRI